MPRDENERALLRVVETLALADGNDGRLSLAAVENAARPGEMPPLHAHESAEAFLVTAGRLTLYVGEHIVPLNPGEQYVVPAGAPHTHVSSEPTRFVTATFVRSAGRYEDFVGAVASPGAMGTAASGLYAIASVNGIAVLGEPGERPAKAA
jgi:mannose-6-phosphate isomerase-like protein (cupin superfamily)